MKASPALQKWAEDNGLFTNNSLAAWDIFRLGFAAKLEEIGWNVKMSFLGIKNEFNMMWFA